MYFKKLAVKKYALLLITLLMLVRNMNQADVKVLNVVGTCKMDPSEFTVVIEFLSEEHVNSPPWDSRYVSIEMRSGVKNCVHCDYEKDINGLTGCGLVTNLVETKIDETTNNGGNCTCPDGAV